MLVAFPISMILIDQIIGRPAGLTLDVIMRGPAHLEASRVDLYLNWVVVLDLISIFFMILLTGGIVRSSFSTLLLLVPVLAMILRATWKGVIVVEAIAMFLLLLALQIPRVALLLRNLLGTFGWLLDFDTSSLGSAHTISFILTFAIAAWSIILQLRTMSSAAEEASHTDRQL